MVPNEESSRNSLPRNLRRSPIQVHNPAITPVSPASGPMLPPKRSGNRAPPAVAPMCLYSYRPVFLTSAITVLRLSGYGPNLRSNRPTRMPPREQITSGHHQVLMLANAVLGIKSQIRLIPWLSRKRKSHTAAPASAPITSVKSAKITRLTIG